MSKMGTPSSEMIIQYVYMALKSLENFYRANGAAVEGLAGRNGHRRKVVGERGGVSWGGAQTKVRGASANSPKYVLSK